jgi:hypothetical protein
MLYSVTICLPLSKIHSSPYSSLPHSRIMAALTSVPRFTAWTFKLRRRPQGIKRLSVLIILLYSIPMPLYYQVHIMTRFHGGKQGGPATGCGARWASIHGWEAIAELTKIKRFPLGLFQLWHGNCWVVIWFVVGVCVLIFLWERFGTLESFKGWGLEGRGVIVFIDTRCREDTMIQRKKTWYWLYINFIIIDEWFKRTERQHQWWMKFISEHGMIE